MCLAWLSKQTRCRRQRWAPKPKTPPAVVSAQSSRFEVLALTPPRLSACSQSLDRSKSGCKVIQRSWRNPAPTTTLPPSLSPKVPTAARALGPSAPGHMIAHMVRLLSSWIVSPYNNTSLKTNRWLLNEYCPASDQGVKLVSAKTTVFSLVLLSACQAMLILRLPWNRRTTGMHHKPSSGSKDGLGT